MPNTFQNILLYCRAGFETDCAAEIASHTESLGISGHIRAKPQSGLVIFVPDDPEEALPVLQDGLRYKHLVFARQMIFCTHAINDLPDRNRIAPLIEAIRNMKKTFSCVWLEFPDTNEGKSVSGLCRRLTPHLEEALKKARLLTSRAHAPRLHICFTSPQSVYIGSSKIDNSAPWPLGFVRLKMPSSSPSRSTVKLAEAFLCLMDEETRTKQLQPRMRAIDLGAAPGGWSWQFAQRGIRVQAIDNGNLDPSVLATEFVEHIRADGFTYKPPRPVDWMVCDIVDQPIRIARLAADWVARGWCQHTIFNLKLPMKKRWQEIERCRDLIFKQLGPTRINCQLRMRQLYHDREEVTAYLSRE